MAEITIVVPVYNAELYLDRCVGSILGQTFSDFDLILVDDGSTDRSGALCDEYALRDARVAAIHQSNKGQAAARNAGIDRAFRSSDSRWISFIDSDDFVAPSYLDTLLSAVRDNDTEISVCDLIKTESSEIPEQVAPADILCMTPEALWEKNRLAATIPVCKLFSKRAFGEFRFPVGMVHEDELLIYRILFSCDKVAYYNAPLYYYYQNPDGVTLQKQWTPERADSVQAFSEQCAFFRRNKYDKAERISAKALLCACYEVLYHLTTEYLEEKRLIRRTRVVLRRTMRRYRARLDLSGDDSDKTYMRYAHPILTKAQKLKKRFIRSVGRLFHA